jgi:hypothetical protein
VLEIPSFMGPHHPESKIVVVPFHIAARQLQL